MNPLLKKIKTREQFIDDATAALKLAPMAIRLTPHLLSVIDWNNPLDDPVRRQFLPLASGIVPDHEELKLDSLNEQDDSRTLPHVPLRMNKFLTATSRTRPSPPLSWESFVSRCVMLMTFLFTFTLHDFVF